ncbi:hypothetical protein INT43_001910 [Umbelopsis isabellina]|uniref:Homeobox domain-containing protein n=1 Tax=Mortierella isabellina TaxID=91625 RepID=A0A8H7UDL2_MORIS|nr:hypothetical protein INT43_001910 [Umbelopsis isabellina]
MQDPIISNSETIQSYFQQPADEDAVPLYYFSKQQLKGLDAFKKELKEPEDVNEISAKSTKFNTPTYDIFHQLPYGEFSPTFYNPFEVKHRRRTTKAQYKILEANYVENPKPNSSTRRKLAMQLEMTTRGVQVWFQNRRAKSKLLKRQANSKPQLKRPSLDMSRRASSVSTVSSWSTSLDEQEHSGDDQYPTAEQLYRAAGHFNGINHDAGDESSSPNQISTPIGHFEHSGYDTTDIVELIMKSSIEDIIPATTDTPMTSYSDNYSLPSSPIMMDNYFSTLQQVQDQLQYVNSKQLDFKEGANLCIQDSTSLASPQCMAVPQDESYLYSQPEVSMLRRYSCPLPFIESDLASRDFIDDSYPTHNVSYIMNGLAQLNNMLTSSVPVYTIRRFNSSDSITIANVLIQITNEVKALEWKNVCEKGLQLC